MYTLPFFPSFSCLSLMQSLSDAFCFVLSLMSASTSGDSNAHLTCDRTAR